MLPIIVNSIGHSIEDSLSTVLIRKDAHGPDSSHQSHPGRETLPHKSRAIPFDRSAGKLPLAIVDAGGKLPPGSSCTHDPKPTEQAVCLVAQLMR
jgi:hypothetical protein